MECCDIIYISNHLSTIIRKLLYLRRVCRYQSGISESKIEEQKTQWPKEKVQNIHIKLKIE